MFLKKIIKNLVIYRWGLKINFLKKKFLNDW